MGVSIRYNDFLNKSKKDLINVEGGVIAIMQECGQAFVKEAKTDMNINSSAFPKGAYHNDTDNLRTSVGYFILRDGEVIEGDGNSDAKSVLSDIQPGRGYRLIGVAGMEYASYVESKGYNVITSQKETCIIDLRSKLQAFAKRSGKKGITIDFETSF